MGYTRYAVPAQHKALHIILVQQERKAKQCLAVTFHDMGKELSVKLKALAEPNAADSSSDSESDGSSSDDTILAWDAAFIVDDDMDLDSGLLRELLSSHPLDPQASHTPKTVDMDPPVANCTVDWNF